MKVKEHDFVRPDDYQRYRCWQCTKCGLRIISDHNPLDDPRYGLPPGHPEYSPAILLDIPRDCDENICRLVLES